jgi:hypothetical protein
MILRDCSLNASLPNLTHMIHDASAASGGYAATTKSLAVQPFDILHEYASGLTVPSIRVVSRLPRSRRTVMNHAS